MWMRNEAHSPEHDFGEIALRARKNTVVRNRFTQASKDRRSG